MPFEVGTIVTSQPNGWTKFDVICRTGTGLTQRIFFIPIFSRNAVLILLVGSGQNTVKNLSYRYVAYGTQTNQNQYKSEKRLSNSSINLRPFNYYVRAPTWAGVFAMLIFDDKGWGSENDFFVLLNPSFYKRHESGQLTSNVIQDLSKSHEFMCQEMRTGI